MISDSKKQKPTSADTTGEPAIAIAVSNHESPITNHNLSNHTPNTDDDTTVIKIRGLTNRFGSQTVHDGLDLDVRRGEILGVVGGSGTGKSVLMRSILGLRRPDAGHIEVLGEDARSEEPAARLHIERNTGVLFQDGALFSSLTVGENVQVPLKEHYAELPELWHYELALLKVKLAGLPADAVNKLPSQLSGGMRKRAGLARALALDPEILFFDEPSAGLDPLSCQALDELILELRDSLGASIVLVTHELPSIYRVADTCLFLDNQTRTQIAYGPLQQLLEQGPPVVRRFLQRGEGPAAAEES